MTGNTGSRGPALAAKSYIPALTPQRRALLGIALMLVVAVVLAACGGDGPVAQRAARPGGELDQPVANAGQLPTPGAVLKDAAAISAPLRCWGGQCRSDLLKQRVAVDGIDALFSPAGAATDINVNDAAIAFYSFDLSPLGGAYSPLRVTLSTPDPGDVSTRVFVGMPDEIHDTWSWGEAQPGVESWSWGETQSGSFNYGSPGSGRISPLMPVVVMVFGDAELRVRSCTVSLDIGPNAGSTLFFRKGWDGTVKCPCIDDGMDIVADGQGKLFLTYFDDTSEQLHFASLTDRTWQDRVIGGLNERAGSSNALSLTADGQVACIFSDGAEGQSRVKWSRTNAVDNYAVWSPPADVDSGNDGSGTLASVGSHISLVVDSADVRHVFYYDETNQCVKHASSPNGTDWTSEVVSPLGIQVYDIAAMLDGDVPACAYVDGTGLQLVTLDVAMWTAPVTLATDCTNPLTPVQPGGFCDAVARDGTAVIAFACTSGMKVVFQDLHFAAPPTEVLADSTVGAGCFLHMHQLADGSVRIAHYNPSLHYIVNTHSLPGTEEFTSLPAVQLDGPDDDCDGLAYYVDEDSDGDTIDTSEEYYVVSSTQLIPGSTTEKKHTKTGHVTLLK